MINQIRPALNMAGGHGTQTSLLKPSLQPVQFRPENPSVATSWGNVIKIVNTSTTSTLNKIQLTPKTSQVQLTPRSGNIQMIQNQMIQTPGNCNKFLKIAPKPNRDTDLFFSKC